MASIIRVGDRWRAQVRRKGMRMKCRTFSTREEAEEWADEYECYGNILALPPELHTLPRIPITKFSGVYFLFSLGECVYVGQSQNVHVRIQEHINKKKIPFEEYAWLPLPLEILDEVERKYIAAISPCYNVRMNLERAKERGWTHHATLRKLKLVATNLRKVDSAETSIPLKSIACE